MALASVRPCAERCGRALLGCRVVHRDEQRVVGRRVRRGDDGDVCGVGRLRAAADGHHVARLPRRRVVEDGGRRLGVGKRHIQRGRAGGGGQADQCCLLKEYGRGEEGVVGGGVGSKRAETRLVVVNSGGRVGGLSGGGAAEQAGEYQDREKRNSADWCRVRHGGLLNKGRGQDSGQLDGADTRGRVER